MQAGQIVTAWGLEAAGLTRQSNWRSPTEKFSPYSTTSASSLPVSDDTCTQVPAS